MSDNQVLSTTASKRTTAAHPMPSAPLAHPITGNIMDRLNEFLDKHVLPYPVRYLSNRIVILATLCLLIPLIALASNQVFVAAVNSYLNVMSVVVSSTVLLFATLSEARDRVAAHRREEIAQAHQAMVEARAAADHERLALIHGHLDDIHSELMDHVSKSLDTIQKALVEHLEKLQLEDHAHIEEMHTAVQSSMVIHKEELAKLREIIEALHPRPRE